MLKNISKLFRYNVCFIKCQNSCRNNLNVINYQNTRFLNYRNIYKSNQTHKSTSSMPVRYFTTADNHGYKTWKGIVTGFIPIGICLIAVVQWRAIRRSETPASEWTIKLYCSLPLRAFSRAWGQFAELKLPEFLRPFVYGLYAYLYNVDLNEAISSDYKYYNSLAEFFARPLKTGARVIDENGLLVSPCDGKVLHFGPVNSCKVEQVKGVTYSLEEFLGKESGGQVEPGDGNKDFRQILLMRPEKCPTNLYQCVLYLAPGDYHRFHSPTNWEPKYRRHVSGELLSVSPRIARWIPGLFVLNERATYIGEWQHGFFSLTAVGATNVGSVKVYCDKTLYTNTKTSSSADCCSLKPVNFEKGEPFGEFRMGSTVVLIFEAPINFEFKLRHGQTVRVGQTIGSIGREREQESYVSTLTTRTLNVSP